MDGRGGEKASPTGGVAGFTGGGVEKALPKYADVGEATVVDLSRDGLPYVPVLGEARYTRVGAEAELHMHPGMMEILLCRRGRGLSIDCADRSYPFPTGTLMVIQPEVPHVIRPKPKNLSTCWIWFKVPKPGAPLPGFSLRETKWLVDRLRSLPVQFPASKAVVSDFGLLWRLFRDLPKGAPQRRMLLREATLRLFIDVIDSSAAANRPADDARLDAVLAEMRADCARQWTLEQLAAKAAMSIPKLTERVRQRTGLPPHQFLVACRMEKAKTLLSDPRRSVGAIANLLGVASARHFSTMFRRETGLSPRQWRQ